MSQTMQDKLNLFRITSSSYDSEEIAFLSLQDVLEPMIDALGIHIKCVLSSLQELKELDDDIMHILRLANAMELLKMHFEFTIGILHSQTEEDVTKLKQKFSLIAEYYEQVKTKEDITPVPAKYVVAMLHDKILAELEKILKKCFKKNKHGEMILLNKQHNLARIQIMTGRFELGYSKYPYVLMFPKDDLYCKEKSAEAWQSLYKIATFKQENTKAQVKTTSKLFHFCVHLSHIIINNQIRNKGNPHAKAVLSLLTEILYYGFHFAKVETQALVYLLKPDVNEAFKAWNLHEIPWICRSFLVLAPMIAYDKMIYLPRLFPKITKESIMKEYQDGTINKITYIDPETLKAPNLGNDNCAIIEELLNEEEDKIPVRILAHKNLNLEESETNIFQYVGQRIKRLLPLTTESKDTEERAIVIHMHGGGFVAMTSASHRIYLTQWVKTLKLIHFSIDYRNSPKNKYPAAVDDVWQAYMWITNYATKVLGIKYQKVILVGDSSGATLALSLMYRLIRAGLPVPHGCLLFYPALLLDSSVASPSYFESLDDTLLPYSLLKLIIEAYLDDDCKRREDPLISPLVASDEYLEKLPPIRIVTGSKDPLYDDNWRFLEKLTKLNKDVKIIVHAHLSHGYICHKLLRNYNLLLDEACELVEELIDKEH